MSSIPLAVALLRPGIVAAAYLDRPNTRYVVTDRALDEQPGLVGRRVSRAALGPVQGSPCEQGVLEAENAII